MHIISQSWNMWTSCLFFSSCCSNFHKVFIVQKDMNFNMQIIRSARKEAASIIWSVNPKVNKLLYLHNQLWWKGKKKKCKMGSLYYQNKELRITPRVQDPNSLQRCLASYHHYRIKVSKFGCTQLCFTSFPSKTIQARMPSRCQACLIACPCTIKPHMKAPQYMHEIYRASYVLIKFVGAR
jgi:hypothetical protein